MYKIPGATFPPLPDVPDTYVWDVAFDGRPHKDQFGVLNQKNDHDRWENVAWLTTDADTLRVGFGPVNVHRDFEYVTIGPAPDDVPSYETIESGLALIAARAWMGMV